jgi:hypothetical protein
MYKVEIKNKVRADNNDHLESEMDKVQWKL